MKTNKMAFETYLYENRVSPTPKFYAGIDAVCDQIRQSEMRERKNEAKRTTGRMPVSRRWLLIAIAAILLLLSACAAYAIYWSSTQRAKEYAQSEQAVDDHLALAERMADEFITGSTFYGAISGTAEVDGITLELKGASYWAYDDPPEMHIAFNATDAKIGDISRLYDFDYVLTVGGKEYPAYAKADGTVRVLPMIAQADAMAKGADHEIKFRIADQQITDGMPMTLSATLYAYDDGVNRGEALGSFTLDFVYTIPTEEIEAARARQVEDALSWLDVQAQEQSQALAGLPDEMYPLNITQDEYTFLDAQVTEEGFLIGKTIVTRGVEAPVFYMDGYLCDGESISSIFTPDMERPRLTSPEGEYYGTSESVFLYPWYAPVEQLPETVLIAVLRDAGSWQLAKWSMKDPTELTDEDRLTFSWEPIELLLRVNPHTGEIALPKDDDERKAWRDETLRLAADGRNERHELKLNGRQTMNGVTVSLYTLDYDARKRTLPLDCFANGIYYWEELNSSPLTVYIDGVLQEIEEPAEPYVFSQEKAEARVERDGGWGPQNNCPGYCTILLPEPARFLPESFTLRVVWDVYDRNRNWERIHIGTFDFTTTVNKTEDIAPWDRYANP